MSIFSRIARNTLAKKIGKSLLNYFESDQFPMELLQDKKLDELYDQYLLYRAVYDDTLEEMDSVELLLTVRRKELDREKGRSSADRK